MQAETITHITDVDPSAITVGDHVEQGGEVYTVTDITGTTTASGFRPTAIYFRWTGSDESDVFRSVVNARGFHGQIRWERPYRKPETLAQPVTVAEPVTHPLETRCELCGFAGSWHGLTTKAAKTQRAYCPAVKDTARRQRFNHQTGRAEYMYYGYGETWTPHEQWKPAFLPHGSRTGGYMSERVPSPTFTDADVRQMRTALGAFL